MSDESGKDTQQRVASKERLDLMWKLLNTNEYGFQYKQMMRAQGRGATKTVAGRKILQLHLSDLEGLIKYRGLTWQTILCHSFYGKHLFVGPIFLTSELGNRWYPSIVNFHNIRLYMVEELQQVDGRDHLETAFQLLAKLFSSHAKDDVPLFALERPSQYHWLFQKCNVQLNCAEFGRVCIMNDLDFVRWGVENMNAVTIFPTELSSEAWSVFCETITGATAKVTELAVMTYSDYTPSTFSPGLIETMKKASTVRSLEIKISESGAEERILDESLKNGHIRKLIVSGELSKYNWLASLSTIIKSDQFASIDYYASFNNISMEENEDGANRVDYDDNDKEKLTNLIRQAKSLTDLDLATEGIRGLDSYSEEIEPIFRERRFQKQARELAHTLESSNTCAALFGRLIGHAYVHPHPDVMFDILRVNIASLKALWDGGRDNRITLFEHSMERSMRELEASRASKKQKLADQF